MDGLAALVQQALRAVWRDNLNWRSATISKVFCSRGQVMIVVPRQECKSHLDCRGAAIRMLF
jgi:hypothetical protein